MELFSFVLYKYEKMLYERWSSLPSHQAEDFEVSSDDLAVVELRETYQQLQTSVLKNELIDWFANTTWQNIQSCISNLWKLWIHTQDIDIDLDNPPNLYTASGRKKYTKIYTVLMQKWYHTNQLLLQTDDLKKAFDILHVRTQIKQLIQDITPRSPLSSPKSQDQDPTKDQKKLSYVKNSLHTNLLKLLSKESQTWHQLLSYYQGDYTTDQTTRLQLHLFETNQSAKFPSKVMSEIQDIEYTTTWYHILCTIDGIWHILNFDHNATLQNITIQSVGTNQIRWGKSRDYHLHQHTTWSQADVPHIYHITQTPDHKIRYTDLTQRLKTQIADKISITSIHRDAQGKYWTTLSYHPATTASNVSFDVDLQQIDDDMGVPMFVLSEQFNPSISTVAQDNTSIYQISQDPDWMIIVKDMRPMIQEHLWMKENLKLWYTELEIGSISYDTEKQHFEIIIYESDNNTWSWSVLYMSQDMKKIRSEDPADPDLPYADFCINGDCYKISQNADTSFSFLKSNVTGKQIQKRIPNRTSINENPQLSVYHGVKNMQDKQLSQIEQTLRYIANCIGKPEVFSIHSDPSSTSNQYHSQIVAHCNRLLQAYGFNPSAKWSWKHLISIIQSICTYSPYNTVQFSFDIHKKLLVGKQKNKRDNYYQERKILFDQEKQKITDDPWLSHVLEYQVWPAIRWTIVTWEYQEVFKQYAYKPWLISWIKLSINKATSPDTQDKIQYSIWLQQDRLPKTLSAKKPINTPNCINGNCAMPLDSDFQKLFEQNKKKRVANNNITK